MNNSPWEPALISYLTLSEPFSHRTDQGHRWEAVADGDKQYGKQKYNDMVKLIRKVRKVYRDADYNKIEAIKFTREVTGRGLKEAKEFFDWVEEDNSLDMPATDLAFAWCEEHWCANNMQHLQQAHGMDAPNTSPDPVAWELSQIKKQQHEHSAQIVKEYLIPKKQAAGEPPGLLERIFGAGWREYIDSALKQGYEGYKKVNEQIEEYLTNIEAINFIRTPGNLVCELQEEVKGSAPEDMGHLFDWLVEYVAKQEKKGPRKRKPTFLINTN